MLTRKTLGYVMLTGSMFLLFLIAYSILRHEIKFEVTFYSSLKIIVLMALIYILVAIGGGIFGKARRTNFGLNEMFIPSLITYVLVSYSFIMTYPVLIERSISVYMIAKVASTPGGLTEGEIEKDFLRQYVREGKAVHVRLNEQLVTGSFIKKGDKYVITDKGMMFYQLHKQLAKIFNINDHFVNPGK